MTILKLAQLGDLILALYCDGHLRGWKISACLFEKECPNLVPSWLKIFLTQDIRGMECTDKRVLA
jgi:hypothetical protein